MHYIGQRKQKIKTRTARRKRQNKRTCRKKN